MSSPVRRSPCAVNDKSMRILYENDAYKKVRRRRQRQRLRQANANLAADDLPMHKKFRTFRRQSCRQHEERIDDLRRQWKVPARQYEIVARTKSDQRSAVWLPSTTSHLTIIKETKRYDEIFQKRHPFLRRGSTHVHMATRPEVLETINPLLKAGNRIPWRTPAHRALCGPLIHRDDQERFHAVCRCQETCMKSRRYRNGPQQQRLPRQAERRQLPLERIRRHRSHKIPVRGPSPPGLRDATMERLREREEKVPEFQLWLRAEMKQGTTTSRTARFSSTMPCSFSSTSPASSSSGRTRTAAS